ncbi:MAG: hypothetical protein M3Y49_16165 [Actinomycetota bacterium]|nr:hypothetical protein [Actinomycetota bacterium]
MSDTAATKEEVLDQQLEIETGLRPAVTGAAESVEDRVRVAEETNRASGRSGTEYQEAAAWTYEELLPGYDPHR